MPDGRRKFFRLVSLCFAVLCVSSCAVLDNPANATKKISHAPPFTPLNDWIYRGSQPDAATLAKLHAKGVRTVINFRDEPRWIQWEKERVEKLGMNYVSLPWNIWKPVKPELRDQFFKVLDDPKNRPVFFHCQHGRDRSGVMAVLALMRYEKLSEADARGLALETIRPNMRYAYFVDRKIDFFLKESEKKKA